MADSSKINCLLDEESVLDEIDDLLNNPPLLESFVEGNECNVELNSSTNGFRLVEELSVSDNHIFENHTAEAVENSNHVPSKYENGVDLTIVVAALVELFCLLKENDPELRAKTFKYVAQKLIQSKIIPTICFSDALFPARQRFEMAFMSLMKEASEISCLTESCVLPTATSSNVVQDKLISVKSIQHQKSSSESLSHRSFSHEFDSICQIGKGGFGQVLKVRSYIDERFYAIKKINFNVSHSALCIKVLREVKILAAVNHPNVVRYYGAWLEFEPTDVIMDSSSSKARNFLKRSLSRHAPEINEIRDDESVTNGHSLSKLRTSFSSPNISFANSSKHDEVSFREPNSARELSDSSADDSSENVFINSSSKRKSQVAKLDDFVVKSIRNSWPLARNLILYLQMELGTSTLRDFLTERNSNIKNTRDVFFCVDASCNERVLRQILKAVDYIHSQGIIHRDIKPSNIFLKHPNNHVLIGDFGLACLMEDESRPINEQSNDKKDAVIEKHSPYHSTGIGTMCYSAPEQLKSHFYDQKVDIYSIGVIVFEMYYPFQTTMERMHNTMELRRGEMCETFQHRWPVEAVFIKRMTQKNPSLRPNAKDLLESGFFQTKHDLIGALKLQLQEQTYENERLMKEIERLKAQDKNCL